MTTKIAIPLTNAAGITAPLGRGRREDDPEQRNAQQHRNQQQGGEFDHILQTSKDLNAEDLAGNIENFIGYSKQGVSFKVTENSFSTQYSGLC